MIIKRIIDREHKELLITVVRCLAGAALIPSALVKVQGFRFSAVFADVHAQSFFYQIYNAGIYWNFLGYFQLFIALLLFTQRLTALLAVVYFSIAINNFIGTLRYGSVQSIYASTILLLIAVLLLLSDWSKVKSLLGFYPQFKDLRKYRSVSSRWGVIGLFTYALVIITVIIVDKPY